MADKKLLKKDLAEIAEVEGLDYIFTDIDPEEVKDKSFARLLRVAQYAYAEVAEYIEGER